MRSGAKLPRPARRRTLYGRVRPGLLPLLLDDRQERDCAAKTIARNDRRRAGGGATDPSGAFSTLAVSRPSSEHDRTFEGTRSIQSCRLRRAPTPGQRTRCAAELGAGLLPLLAPDVHTPRERTGATVVSVAAKRPPASSFHFGVRAAPGRMAGIRQVAWDADGHFLAATESGLAYWDDWSFRAVPLETQRAPRVVHRTGLRRWLIGGQGAIQDFANGAVARTVTADPRVAFVALSGSFDSGIVAVGRRESGAHELWMLRAKRFERASALADITRVIECVAVGGGRYLVAGNDATGAGTVLLVELSRKETSTLLRLPGSAVTACGSRPELGAAICAFEDGRLVRHGRKSRGVPLTRHPFGERSDAGPDWPHLAGGRGKPVGERRRLDRGVAAARADGAARRPVREQQPRDRRCRRRFRRQRHGDRGGAYDERQWGARASS